MKKGGALISVENLIWLVLVLIVLVPIFQYFNVIPSIFAKDKTTAEQDLARVLEEVDTLTANDRVEVNANGADYAIALYNSKDAPKQCKGYPCICVKEGIKPASCELIIGMKEKCELNKPCISESSVYNVKYEEGKGKPVIAVCSVGNSIKLGEGC
ncbi:hypothetical protein HY837_00415 [archaeon]|nr:hypothetical protein [archaeon]